jgi:O-antigen/teichoic acid export membrane protein
MGNLKDLAGDTAIYGLSSIVGRAVNFLLVPFYTSTRILSVEEYGVVSELYAYAAVFNVLLLYGMETAFFRFITKHPDQRDRVFSTAFTSVLVSTAGFIAIMYLFATPIVQWLEFPGKEHFVYLLACILGIDAVAALPFAMLRFQRRAWRFASIRLLNIGLNVLLNIFFLYVCEAIYAGAFLQGVRPAIELFYNPALDVEYVFVSNLMANAIFVVMLWPIIATVRPLIRKGLLVPMLVYASPLLFSQLAGITNEMFSRMTLKKLLPEGFYPGLNSQEALSIFAACYKLSIFMTLAIQAFRFAAEPFFFSQSKHEGSRNTYAQVFYYFSLAGMVAFLGISLNLDWIKRIFLSDEVYWQGLHIVPVLLIANFFLGVYYNISIWFKITDKTLYGTYIALGSAAVTILFNILLIPRLGYEGSALTTLIAYASMGIAVYLLGRIHYPVPYNIKRVGLYFLLAVALLLAGWQIDTPNIWVQQLLKEVPLLLFLAVVALAERKNFKFNIN